jgi:hypothetical protein
MLWMQLLLAPVPPTGPSPWNAVTITTAIVSVAALLLAGLTFWLNYWRGRVRKPRWAHGWEMQDNGTLNFWLSNRGAGLGLDARVTAREGEYASQSNLGNVEYSKG